MSKKHINKRTLLKGLAAGGLILPFSAIQGLAADVDVVIIGAGAAGLGAARQMMAKGKSFKLVEAGNRIGGRAFTDSNKFGVPFDLGCTYQHYAKSNPFVRFAKDNNIPLKPLPGDYYDYVNIGHREATGSEWAQMVSKYEAMYSAIKRAGIRGQDISMRKAIRKVEKNKWTPIAEKWHGGSMGADLENISVLDWWNRPEGFEDETYCPSGYGTLVEVYGKGIPVELNTVVREIEVAGNRVAVTTNKGTITAKHCLVTVSQGVLASELIKFKPGLSKRKLRAIDSLEMAHYVIFGLKFERQNIYPARDMAWFFINDGQKELLTYMGNMGGHGIQRATASGSFAIELQNMGEGAALEFVKKRMSAGLHANTMKLYQDGIMSKWSNDPFFKGTWALSKPGRHGKRGDMSKSEHKRLHFAGEATSKVEWGLCQGALTTGIRAGKRLSNLI